MCVNVNKTIFCISTVVIAICIFAAAKDSGAKTVRDGTCDYGLTWSVSDGVLTIKGEGNMRNFGVLEMAPWDDEDTSVVSVVVESGVTSIGNFAFDGIEGLKEVYLADTVTSIGESAFAMCQNLTKVIIPDSVSHIEKNAFSYCTNLRTVVIGSGIVSIGPYAFDNCRSLDSVTYKGSNSVFCSQCFMDCTLLNTVCILQNSNSSWFCGLNLTRPSQNFLENENKCFNLICENNEWIVQQNDSVGKWESEDMCSHYICDNESGFISWNKCYSTDNKTLVCVNSKCVESNTQEKWIVRAEIEDLKVVDLDLAEDISLLAKIIGLKEDDIVAGVEVDDDGNVLRVSLYIGSEEKAKIVEEVWKKCK